jgi:phage-related protein
MLGFTWYDAAGSATALSGLVETGQIEGIGVLDGVRGLEMPPYALISDEVPQQPGARFRNLKTLPREVDLPLFVRSTSEVGLRFLLRTLRHALDPARGDGRLRVTAPDGSQRYLTCRYTGPWTGDLSADAYYVSALQFLATFQALDPYFYDPGPQVVTFAIGTTIVPFFPFFPLHLNASGVLGDITVSNTGDVEAHPLWTITGPGSNIILRNLSVIPQAVLEVDTSLTTGQQLIVDTRPGHKTVVGPGGTNLYGAVNASSQLWSLPVGSNTLRVEVTGATVDTAVRLEWTPRFLGI